MPNLKTLVWLIFDKLLSMTDNSVNEEVIELLRNKVFQTVVLKASISVAYAVL